MYEKDYKKLYMNFVYEIVLKNKQNTMRFSKILRDEIPAPDGITSYCPMSHHKNMRTISDNSEVAFLREKKTGKIIFKLPIPHFLPKGHMKMVQTDSHLFFGVT